MIAHRRHHFLPGRREDYVRRPDAAGDRPRARQVARSGDAALAPAGGPLGVPEVDQARPHRRDFDVFDFELDSEQIAAIDALDTGVRGGPDPDSITLESYGIEIPEA